MDRHTWSRHRGHWGFLVLAVGGVDPVDLGTGELARAEMGVYTAI